VSSKDINEYVARRIKDIQKRYNFDPRGGVAQIKTAPELGEPYWRFRELVEMVQKLSLQVDVLYDPNGGNNASAIKPRETYVYFARKAGTDVYKIGFSKTPVRRVQEVQTGNDGHLHLVAQIPGGRELESKIKRELQQHKPRDRNKSHKGEWFQLTPEILKETLRRHGGAT